MGTGLVLGLLAERQLLSEKKECSFVDFAKIFVSSSESKTLYNVSSLNIFSLDQEGQGASFAWLLKCSE